MNIILDGFDDVLKSEYLTYSGILRISKWLGNMGLALSLQWENRGKALWCRLNGETSQKIGV